MRECIGVKRALSQYADKEANDIDSAFIKAHLDACPACSGELTELSRVKEMVSGKERKELPRDYLVSRLRERVMGEQLARKKLFLAGIGNLARKFIPIPVTLIALSIVFLALFSRQSVSGYSIEDRMLSGTPATTETALALILETKN